MKQTAAEISTVKPVSRDHCHESPPVMKDHIFLASEPTFQRNWTCCQRPSVLRDNILWLMGRSFKAGSTVVKYRLKIICQLQQLLKWMDMYIHTYACLELRGCIIRTTDHSSAAWVTNFIVCPCVLKFWDCMLSTTYKLVRSNKQLASQSWKLESNLLMVIKSTAYFAMIQ